MTQSSNPGPESLVRDLEALGVQPGDALMVHVSMRAVGPVEGGARGLVLALDDAVGPSGTILVNLGAEDEWAWVNTHPEAERPGLLIGSPLFDPASTPAGPEVGVFAEAFRTTPGTMVSNHPEGRFGARGRLADAFTRSVPWDHYYGPGSPLERFVDAGGRVLRLGADIDTTTLIHLAENLVDLPAKRVVRRHRLVAGPTGPVVRTIDGLDDTDGIATYDVDEDEFGAILRDYLATGRAETGPVGRAAAELLDGPDLVVFAQRWILEHVVTP